MQQLLISLKSPQKSIFGIAWLSLLIKKAQSTLANQLFFIASWVS